MPSPAALGISSPLHGYTRAAGPPQHGEGHLASVRVLRVEVISIPKPICTLPEQSVAMGSLQRIHKSNIPPGPPGNTKGLRITKKEI